MAEKARSIFRKQAQDQLDNPDDLNKYLRVIHPSGWLMLLSVVVLLGGLLAWGFFGSVETSVSTVAVNMEGDVMCFLSTDSVSRIRKGDAAYVNGTPATVADISKVPLSPEEAKVLLKNDYLVDTLMPGNWGYKVTLDVSSDLSTDVPLGASITTQRVAPVTLFWQHTEEDA